MIRFMDISWGVLERVWHVWRHCVLMMCCLSRPHPAVLCASKGKSEYRVGRAAEAGEVRWGSSFIRQKSISGINNSPEASSPHLSVPTLQCFTAMLPGTMAVSHPLQLSLRGECGSNPHYTPDTERVIIIGDDLGKCGNIGVMASKCGRIVHPEVLMTCSGLPLVCSSGLQPGLISHSRVWSLFVSPAHLHGDADYWGHLAPTQRPGSQSRGPIGDGGCEAGPGTYIIQRRAGAGHRGRVKRPDTPEKYPLPNALTSESHVCK